MNKKYEDLLYSNGTLKNKFNIIDKNELKVKEEECSLGRMIILNTFPEKMKALFGTSFDHQHLKKMHKYLLGDVYSWAGEYKQFSLYKGQEILNGRSVNYAPVEFLKENLDEVFKVLRVTKWQDLPTREKILKFADTYQYLWQCHPFNEGNTRTTSMFMKQFAHEYNIPIDFKKLFADPLTLRNSFVLYATGNNDKPMKDLFLNCIIESEQDRLLDIKTLPINVYNFVKGKIIKEELINKKFQYNNNTWEIIDLQKNKGQANANALIFNCDTHEIYLEKDFARDVKFILKLNQKINNIEEIKKKEMWLDE